MVLATIDSGATVLLGGIALWMRMEHRVTQVEDKLKEIEKSLENKPAAKAAVKEKDDE